MPAPRPSFLPQLEQLEDRMCPSGQNLFWNPIGGSGNFGTAINWRLNSDNGAVSMATPDSTDTCTLDNAARCSLDVNTTVLQLKFTPGCTNSLDMGGHLLVVLNFNFEDGVIDFSNGGTLQCIGGLTDTWKGTASFNSSNGSGVVKLLCHPLTGAAENLTLSGTGTKNLQCALEIGNDTGASGASMNVKSTATGTIACGTTGVINVHAIGSLYFHNTGSFTVSSSSATKHTANKGTFAVDGTGGITDYQLSIENDGVNSTLLVDCEFGTFSVEASSLLEAVFQSLGTTTVYTNETFTVGGDGYKQSGGVFSVNGDVFGNEQLLTNGDFTFVGGSCYLNANELDYNVTWIGNGVGAGADSLSFSGCDLYMHVNDPTRAGTDFIEDFSSVTLGGNIHIKDNGLSDGNGRDLIQASTIMTGAFSNEYNGWTGTATIQNNGLNSSVTTSHHYRISNPFNRF